MFVEAVERGHVAGGQLEVKQVEVLALMVFAIRFRNRHDPVLQIPAQNDLRGRFAVLTAISASLSS